MYVFGISTHVNHIGVIIMVQELLSGPVTDDCASVQICC